ncbi:MAG: hypothetical protein AAFZ52_11100, partial [Bacteroidota bacterium]
MEDPTLDRQFADYLEGRMSASEREAFARRVAADPALTTRLKEERAAYRIVTEAGQTDMRVQMLTYEQEWQAAKLASRTKLRWVSWSLVVLILLALLGWWTCPTTPRTADEVFAAYYEAYPAPPRTRGRAQEALWQRAHDAYTSASYALAAARFDSLTTTSDYAY